MRLLEFDSRGILTLTKNFDENIPCYTLLSHSWGADFKDLGNGSSKIKAGYKKLLFCGEQAQKDGLQYFWVDTYLGISAPVTIPYKKCVHMPSK